MKVALITTTINTPHVLKLYRQHGPDVKFFIALDKKLAPDIGSYGYDELISWLTPLWQSDNWSCSELIGWNCIQRRNLALLEAVKWGADVIVSIDDDNIPLDSDYFLNAKQLYSVGGRSGLKAESLDGWFDYGKLLHPPAPQRGFPITKSAQPSFTSVVDAKVGVVAGTILGDPDISAVTRIANGPIAHGFSELLRTGFVVDPDETWTVFNSQNTAFIRELAPAFFMLPGIGRYDDIYASLIMQRVMAERKLHVHHGKPFVWQQRNPHDLMKDLQAEMFGMLNVERFAKYLDSVVLAPGSVIAQLRQILDGLDVLPNSFGLLPTDTIAAYRAFLNDMEPML